MPSVFSKELPKKKKHKDLRKAVCAVVDTLDDGEELSSIELYNRVIVSAPDLQGTFLETVLRYVRYYRRKNMVCVSRSRSIYRKVSA